MAQRHILVVGDDRLVLAELSEGLRGAGYRVSGAASGEDALTVAGRDAPDLALLDVRMPDMSGIEVGGRLREAGVPFLYLSASCDQDIVSQAVEEGAYGYLVKPLDIRQIVPSIEAVLDRAREINRLQQNEAHLNVALAGSRAISMAVGLLMMRDRLDRRQASELLRSHARSQRRAVEEIAKELLDSAESFHAVSELKRPRERAERS